MQPLLPAVIENKGSGMSPDPRFASVKVSPSIVPVDPAVDKVIRMNSQPARSMADRSGCPKAPWPMTFHGDPGLPGVLSPIHVDAVLRKA